MKFRFFVLFLLFGIALSACGGVETPAVDNPQEILVDEGTSAAGLLEGTSWKLLHYRKTQVRDGLIITARFEGTQVSGSAGCNSYSGTYQIDGDKITIGPLASTMMACLDPADVMEMEQMFLEWMSNAQTLDLTEDQLMIFRPDGEALTFIPEF